MNDYKVNGKVYEITLENGKVVKAMVSFIETMMANLKLDEEDAILTWLEDNDYLVNDEQEELDNEAKKVKLGVKATDGAKEKKKRTVVRKANPDKEMIIAELAKVLPNFAEDVVIENVGKLITFKVNGKEFKLDLVEKRAAKKAK